ncbi:MAG: SPOR domain-containing protein [Bacteroidota bacterium]
MTDTEHKKNSEDSEQNSSTSNENTNPTPKDKDELYIELDDSTEKNTDTESAEKVQAAAQKNENSESPINSEEPIQTKNTNENTSAKNKSLKKGKPKKATHKAKPPKETKIPRDKNGKGKKRLIIFGSAIGIILIAGIIMFTQYPKVLAGWMPFLEMKGYADSEVLTEISNESPESSDDADESESSGIAAIDSLESEIETAIEENIDEENVEKKDVSEEEVVNAITKDLQKTQQKYSGSSQIPTTKIETPSWIIGYASVSNNNNAIKSVKSLRDKGYSAGYFWIPDYTEGGPDLFKVYIGPFNSKAEAQNLLPTIKELVPNAYVMYLE